MKTPLKLLVLCLTSTLTCSFAFADEIGEVKAAAEKGDAKAQAALGYCYTSGQGVAKDPIEAVKWYRKAADQGNPDAQLLLGSCYASGQGVGKDLVEAARLCRMAAEQGHAGAQRFLGTCYASGKGVTKDYVQSYAWFSLAAANGDGNAAKCLQGIELLMSQQQKSEAAKLFQELQALPKK